MTDAQPDMAAGGIVHPATGGTLAMVGTGDNETVIPLTTEEHSTTT